MSGSGPLVAHVEKSAEALEHEVERYLAGDLSPEETREFERNLAHPRLGGAFREILLVRELLHSAPPHGVPEGLNGRIAQALEAEMAGSTPAEESALARQARIAREGSAWIFRGPSMALAGLPGTTADPDEAEADSGQRPTRTRAVVRAAVGAARAAGSLARAGDATLGWLQRRARKNRGPR